ncbi:SixA phosphatase family protein [Leucobacter sp. W1153]|uniref:SixA phosphatase family protein n=1 Tax=Leucobacter sp. W1153 TaxID=3439064 RepID=UPI003F39D27C
MVELVLVRHAKSDWGDPGLPDHERPLNARGAANAPMMARRLANTGFTVNRIVSSTAVRARTTAAAFGAALGCEVELAPHLYDSSAETLLGAAVATGAGSGAGRAGDQDAPAVAEVTGGQVRPRAIMLVAHNPGITDLASRLSTGGIDHMPTCAVARFVWATDEWNEAATRSPNAWSLDTVR